MTAALLVVLASVISGNQTSWMRPDLFHLVIGMPRAEAVHVLEESGWKVKKGDDDDHLVIDYSDDKSLTLRFQKNRLRAVNFELFALVPQAKTAFAEQREVLRQKFGEPRRSAPAILVYDNRLPNVLVVLQANPKSEQGRRGLGLLVVRYFDPRS
jgi:hypothetical protein